ncbi:MAG: hypothetical protein V3U64_01120, partial [Cocleimonas sp.]
MKTFTLHSIVTMFILSMLIGCGGGSSSPKEGNETPPVTTATRLVEGLIRDFATAEALSGIDVSIGSRTVKTNADGAYSVLVDGQDAIERVVVNVSGNGYTTTSKITPIAAGANATATLDIDILAVASSSQQDPTTDFTATVAGSPAQVIIGANTLVDANGNYATGTVTVDLTPINPALDIELMPGDMTVSGGAPIASYGALTTDFTNAAGKALNLASGKTATVRIPVASRETSPPSTIPLFYFNEDTGFWVQDGTATLDATSSYYEGTVEHFTTWNADYLYANTTIEGCVMDESGNRVANALVSMEGFNYSGMTTSSTDANGDFTITTKQLATSLIVASTSDQVSNTVKVSTGIVPKVLTDCLLLGDVPLTVRLTWGENPRDLDTHVIGKNGYHIYFVSKGSLVSAPLAQLDVDDTSGYGPEVFTALSFPEDGTYHYAVYRYSGSSTISASPARVELTLEGQTRVFVP